METQFKFRRATHDAKTGQYLWTNTTSFQKGVWDKYGMTCHSLCSKKPMSLEELMVEIRSDSTNYNYSPSCSLPTRGEITLALVRLLEAGFVEMVPAVEPKYDYYIHTEPNSDYEEVHTMKNTDREGVAAWIKGFRETSHLKEEFQVQEFELGSNSVRDTLYF